MQLKSLEFNAYAFFKSILSDLLCPITLFQIASNDLCLRRLPHYQHKRMYADANPPFPNPRLLYQHHYDAQLTRISTLSTTTTSKPNIESEGYFGFLSSFTIFRLNFVHSLNNSLIQLSPEGRTFFSNSMHLIKKRFF